MGSIIDAGCICLGKQRREIERRGVALEGEAITTGQFR